MELSVCSVAYPFAPVKGDTAGGAEQVLLMLDSQLKERGHRSIVIACQGSEVEGELKATPAIKGVISESEKIKIYEHYKNTIMQIIHNENIDIFHFHGIDFCEYLPSKDIVALATLHLPLSWYDERIKFLKRENFYMNCVSRTQEQTSHGLNELLPFIVNGVPFPEIQLEYKRGNYLLCLGRICPEKGYDLAIRAANKAGFPIIIAGSVFPYNDHLEYYRNIFEPMLDKKVRYAGSVDRKQKHTLLSHARCLLIPSLVDETSSLVAMEALSFGTPVIAFRKGALPEIIDNARNGFLVDSVDEMADAIKSVDTLDLTCNSQVIRKKYSAQRMADDYINTYMMILEKQKKRHSVK